MVVLADLRILVVDDDVFMRDMISIFLESFGVTAVATAEGAEEGIALAISFRPDVILCDIVMHPISGSELLRRVRNHADPSLRKTPIIMVTGSADEEAISESRELRADGILVKPVLPHVLNARLTAMAQKITARV
jgi:two-component system chemotaxis response regulator CheY